MEKPVKPLVKGSFVFERFTIPYRVFGEGQDIICLNGAQQSMAMWFSFVQRFAHRYRITLFDFPHQGKAKINRGAYSVSLDEQVDILKAVISELDIAKATICSASWGGVVVLLFTLRYPQNADRLILSSIGMKPNARMRDTILKGIALDKNSRKEMAELLIASFGNNLPALVKEQIVAQFLNMSEERVQAFSEHGLSVILKETLAKVVPLTQVSKHTTILYGENDMILDYQDVESMGRLLPNCAIRIIPNVGHFLHLESEKVFEVYEEILSSNPLAVGAPV